ncbi:uncharacterized protein BDW70DRAFT_81871 [Aspergillus foveolatus]|uniref:uncharacterized protein n=1 Tax=Aspergillus foveolatus TaxID=210207 RepID=UPI003CCDD668
MRLFGVGSHVRHVMPYGSCTTSLWHPRCISNMPDAIFLHMTSPSQVEENASTILSFPASSDSLGLQSHRISSFAILRRCLAPIPRSCHPLRQDNTASAQYWQGQLDNITPYNNFLAALGVLRNKSGSCSDHFGSRYGVCGYSMGRGKGFMPISPGYRQIRLETSRQLGSGGETR